MPCQLQFQGRQSPSLAAKSSIVSWYTLSILAAAWSLWTAPPGIASGTGIRQAALFLCAVIYVFRAAVTLFVFVRRRIPWWEAVLGGGLIGFVLYAFLAGGFRVSRPPGLIDLFGMLLYIAGSYIGTASERARHAWKERPENHGHLYTGGLFRASRHINYFGDLLLFGGFALLTGLAWAAIVPLIMGLSFVSILIPAHDAYLRSRYGAEFEAHARRTKRLIPFVY